MEKLFDFDCTKLEEPVGPISDAMLWCVDRRIQGLRGKFAAHLGIGQHVPLIIPGGIKKIVAPKFPRDAELLMETIALIHYKLGVRRLFAMAHLHCADCEGSSDPTYYHTLLMKGGRILARRFPSLEIKPIFVDCKGVHLIQGPAASAAA